MARARMAGSSVWATQYRVAGDGTRSTGVASLRHALTVCIGHRLEVSPGGHTRSIGYWVNCWFQPIPSRAIRSHGPVVVAVFLR